MKDDIKKYMEVVEGKIPFSTDKLFADIAKKYLYIDTLETRNSDSLDFHDVSVWAVKEALQAAFNAGQMSKKGK
jgi:hypothetical protein